MTIFDYSMLWCAFYGLCVGVFAGICYDVLRIRRIACSPYRYGKKPAAAPLQSYFQPPPKQRFWGVDATVVFIEDFLFLTIFGIAVSILIFYENDGILRWYALFTCAFGFFCYRVTLGAIVMRCSDAILAKLKKGVRFLLAHTVYPIMRFVKRLIWKGKRCLCYAGAKKRTEVIFSHLADQLSPFAIRREQKEKKEKKQGTQKGGAICNSIHPPRLQKRRKKRR